MIRALWFTNTAFGADKILKGSTFGGSWLIALEETIKVLPSMKLKVAFYYHIKVSPFSNEGVHYFPIYLTLTSSGLSRVFNRFFPRYR